MFYGAIGDFGYNLALFLHIVTAIIAFAPAFVHPLLLNQTRSDPGVLRAAGNLMVRNGQRIYAPALVVTGVLGFGVAGFSDGVYKVSQGWLIAAVVIWIAINGILHAVIVPAEKAMADGDERGKARLDVAGPVVTVLFLVVLYLMIWKPGL